MALYTETGFCEEGKELDGHKRRGISSLDIGPLELRGFCRSHIS